MEERPSQWCEECIWWREDPFLCAGCPNNLRPQKTTKSDLDEILCILRKKGTLRSD
jgi:hypothetical protein